jgi:hypothetical protein
MNFLQCYNLFGGKIPQEQFYITDYNPRSPETFKLRAISTEMPIASRTGYKFSL